MPFQNRDQRLATATVVPDTGDDGTAGLGHPAIWVRPPRVLHGVHDQLGRRRDRRSSGRAVPPPSRRRTSTPGQPLAGCATNARRVDRVDPVVAVAVRPARQSGRPVRGRRPASRDIGGDVDQGRRTGAREARRTTHEAGVGLGLPKAAVEASASRRSWPSSGQRALGVGFHGLRWRSGTGRPADFLGLGLVAPAGPRRALDQ